MTHQELNTPCEPLFEPEDIQIPKALQQLDQIADDLLRQYHGDVYGLLSHMQQDGLEILIFPKGFKSNVISGLLAQFGIQDGFVLLPSARWKKSLVLGLLKFLCPAQQVAALKDQPVCMLLQLNNVLVEYVSYHLFQWLAWKAQLPGTQEVEKKHYNWMVTHEQGKVTPTVLAQPQEVQDAILAVEYLTMAACEFTLKRTRRYQLL
jgi:hypothetical protein